MDANLLSSHSNSLLRDANDNESSRAHILISRDQGFISLLVLCNASPNPTKRLELLNDSPAVQEVYLNVALIGCSHTLWPAYLWYNTYGSNMTRHYGMYYYLTTVGVCIWGAGVSWISLTRGDRRHCLLGLDPHQPCH